LAASRTPHRLGRCTDAGHSIRPLLRPYPADQMEEWHISDAARNPRNDYPELIKPVDDDKPAKQGRMI
jgi:putative SOS response-associated peptidase YedK